MQNDHAAVKISLFFLVITCPLLTGCETVTVEHYRIASAASSSAEREQARVVLLQRVQQKLGDFTAAWKFSNTIVLYSDSPLYRVELGARVVGKDIFVDLYCGYSPPPAEYLEMRRLLGPALVKAFGTRVHPLRAGAIAHAPISLRGLTYEQVKARFGVDPYYDKVVTLGESSDANMGFDPSLEWTVTSDFSLPIRQVGWLRRNDYPILVWFRIQQGRWVVFDTIDPTIRSHQPRAALQLR